MRFYPELRRAYPKQLAWFDGGAFSNPFVVDKCTVGAFEVLEDKSLFRFVDSCMISGDKVIAGYADSVFSRPAYRDREPIADYFATVFGTIHHFHRNCAGF
jgi:hypothetical protein